MDVARTRAAPVLRNAARAGRRALLVLPATACLAAGCQSIDLFSGKDKPSPQAEMAAALQESARIEAAATNRPNPGLGSVPPSIDEQIRLGELELESHSRDQNPAHMAAAKHYFGGVLQAQPGHPKAHHRLAVIADLEKDFATAAQHYSQAMRGTPGDPYLLHDIGYSYILQGKYEDAIPYLQRSAQVSPGFEPAVRKLADVYVRTGQPELARQTLQQVLPEQQAAQEVAQLRRMADPAAKPSLFGKVKNNLQDLRPEQRSASEDPTQKLLAELQQARQDGERLRAEKNAQRQAPPGANPWGGERDPRYAAPQPAVPDANLAQAMAQIDRSSQRAYGPAPGSPAAGAYYGDPQGRVMTADGAISPWGDQTGVTLAGGYPPAPQYGPSSGPMTGGQVPFTQVAPNAPQSVDPSYQPAPAYYPPQNPAFGAVGQTADVSAGPGGVQYAEIIRGTERGVAQPWPSRSWRDQGASPQGAPRPQGSDIQLAGGPLAAPGALSPSLGGNLGVSRADLMQPPPVNVGLTPPSFGATPAGQPSPLSFQTPPMLSAGPPAAADDDLRAAAAAGLGAGPGQMLPVFQQTERLSPGSNSGWNGLQFAQPGRQLPTDRPPADLSRAWQMPGPQPGMSGAQAPPPSSLGQQMPSTGQYLTQPDHYSTGGWGTQPNFQAQAPVMPQPTSQGSYDQQRAQYNQQYNSMIRQMHSQSPAGVIPTPSAGIPIDRPPVPSSQMNSWYGGQNPSPAADGRFVTPDRYPSAPAQGTTPSWGVTPQVAPNSGPSNTLPPATYSSNVVVPEAYQPAGRPQVNARPPVQPQGYGSAPSYGSAASTGTSGGYNGPIITPRY
jgi:Tfp pilus assembly protein PilF